MDKYEQSLVNIASKLDAITDSYGKITKLTYDIIDDNSKSATVLLLKKIYGIIESKEINTDVKHIAQLLNTSLIEYYGYSTLQSICKTNIETVDTRSLEELLVELNSLVGLENVKNKVNELIAYQKVQKMRRDNNLYSSKNTLHLAFTGNPGTGKTTVARIVGHIYKKIGLLSKGHFVEVSRTDLIAGYQGQTALKVKDVIERAKGGVLFIDEAYSITENEHSDSYGRECLTELTKALEDYREDLVVIVAGYTEPMNKFFESNPGLKSRFNTFIEFEDYHAEDLREILNSMCNKNDYKLTKEADELLKKYFENEVINKKENFANGRMVRNLFDDLVMQHAKRVNMLSDIKKEDLFLIRESDICI